MRDRRVRRRRGGEGKVYLRGTGINSLSEAVGLPNEHGVKLRGQDGWSRNPIAKPLRADLECIIANSHRFFVLYMAVGWKRELEHLSAERYASGSCIPSVQALARC